MEKEECKKCPYDPKRKEDLCVFCPVRDKDKEDYQRMDRDRKAILGSWYIPW